MLLLIGGRKTRQVIDLRSFEFDDLRARLSRERRERQRLRDAKRALADDQFVGAEGFLIEEDAFVLSKPFVEMQVLSRFGELLDVCT